MPITVISNDPAADTQAMKPAEAAGSTETPSAPGTEAVTEQKTPPESETVETEDEEEGEESEEAAATEAAADPAAEPKPKKKGGFKKRIDKLTQRVTAKEQEVEFWKQQALKSAGAQPEPKPVVEAKPAAAEGRPDPEKFGTHAEYIEALTDWKTEQKFVARDQKLEQARLLAERGTIVESYQTRAKEFAKKTPDFQAVIEDANGIPVSAAVREVIFSSDNGPELAYELAKDKAEFARICALSPLAAAVEMGALRNRLALKKSSESTTETKKTTSAPNPINPVRGGKAAVHKTPEEFAAAGDYQGYKRAMNERSQNKRR